MVQPPTPYPFMYKIGRKGTSFLHLLLTNGTPLTILRATGRTFASSNVNIFNLHKAVIPRNLSMETLKSRSWSLIYTFLNQNVLF